MKYTISFKYNVDDVPEIITRQFDDIGDGCRWFRTCILEDKMINIAPQMGITPQTLLNFEKSRSYDLRIVQWYIDHGMMLTMER